MRIYEENLKLLTESFPGMDKLIEEAKENCTEEIEVIEELSYDGEKILKVKKEEKSYYLNGKRNTTEAAEMWVKTLGELQTNSPVFLFGLGNWHYLKELAEQTQNKIAIFVYEPSLQIFLKVLEEVSFREWMEKQTIVFWVEGLKGMNADTMKAVLRRIVKYEMLSYSQKFILPNYEVLFKEKAVAFLSMIRDIAKDEVMQYNTQRLFSHVYAMNVLSNVKYLCDGYKTVQLVEVIPRDIPGIVVAAGPSLNKNIKELKKAKGKAFIVAVDTAIKPLLEEGIVPDLFATIDGKKPLMLVEREDAKEIPLMSRISANRELLDYHTGKKFFSNEGVKIADQVFAMSKKGVGTVDTGGSVATDAFSLLYKIGLKTIILVGQDLAYTNNRSHADGTFAEKMKEEDTKKYIMVEGNIEEKVPTIANLKMYLDWYGNYIRIIKNQIKDLKIINATEGGAKIDGTEVMTLCEAIEQECTKEVDIQECFARLKPMLDEENQIKAKEYLKSIPEKFSELERDAKKLKRLYRKLDKLCNQKNMDKKAYVSLLKRIKKVTKSIEGNDTYPLIMSTMINAQYILWSEQFVQEDSIEKEGLEIARKGILYTENVANGANAFKRYAEEQYTDL